MREGVSQADRLGPSAAQLGVDGGHIGPESVQDPLLVVKMGPSEWKGSRDALE